LRLALAQTQWWQIRGRLTSQAPLLAAAAELAAPGSDEWCAVRMCLGQAAGLLADSGAALEHYTAVRDALEDAQRPASLTRAVLLSMCLSGRSSALLQVGRVDEAADDGLQAQALAREVGIPGLEAIALACLSGVAWHGGDRDGALQAAHQAQHVTDDMPGGLRRNLAKLGTAVPPDAGVLAPAHPAWKAAGVA